MRTTYPFDLPTNIVAQLPAPTADGLCDIDVRVRGAWDGILVVNADGRCIGIRVRRCVEEYPLPFEPSDIEAVRPACLWNRALAAVPFDLYGASLVTVLFASPTLLILSRVAWPPLSGIAVVACLVSIYVMYKGSGFPFIRPLAALFGLGQAIVGGAWFVRWASAWLSGSA